MATTDYDAPRVQSGGMPVESLEELTVHRDVGTPVIVDIDEVPDEFTMAGAEIVDEDLSVAVVPMRANEFRCDRCFLVRHRTQLAHERGGIRTCSDCR